MAPGACLQQADPNDLIAQQFSFEDAGGGFFYVRTHTGNLYLTTDDTLAVMQQPKYRMDASTGGANRANLQRWRLAPDLTLGSDRTRFTIRNAAFPVNTLQPSGGGAASGTPVVLGDPQAAPGNAFRIFGR